MKVFEIVIPDDVNFASLRMVDNDLDISDATQNVEYMWEDWDTENNIIQDFVPAYFGIVGKKKILERLTKKNRGATLLDVVIKPNPKELKAKNVSRLKWLPQDYPDLSVLKIEKEVSILPQSSVEFDEDGYIEEVKGISEVIGNQIIPRQKGKGFFFEQKKVEKFAFFKPQNTNYPLCTESVKRFCESENYSNILFLEVGNII